MASPELSTIEVGNKLSDAESTLISDLKTDAFGIDAQKEDIDEMKESLKTSKINVITSAVGITPEVKTLLSLSEIATAFATYVEQWEGWKLKLVESNKTSAPEWIKYIIDNPQNNDLAYFVQKLAGLIKYQTAKAYTKEELTAVDVSIDKAFGNQTKRALAWLKTWIENDQDYKTVAEWSTYTGKYVDEKFLEWVISTKTTDAEKTLALGKYNLQYKDAKIQPADWYKFIDENSNNYAVEKGTIDSKVAIDTGELDSFQNTIMTITSIDQLPKDTDGNYKRPETDKKVYDITLDNVDYRFYGTGRVFYWDKKWNSKDIIAELDKTEKKDKIPKTVEYDAYGNEIVIITDITKLPLEKWTETKCYSYTKDNIVYRFYNDGNVYNEAMKKNYKWTDVVEKTKTNDGWKWKGELLETEYAAIEKEMDTYIWAMNTDLSVMYFADTKTYSILWSSGIEEYKDSVKVDVKNKSISYLWQSIVFDKDTPYKELFYAAAKSYELINKRAS